MSGSRSAGRGFVLICLASVMLIGCAPTAEEFFAGGRKSQLSEVHRKAASGGEKEMLKLYRVPARFPDATDLHKKSWQRAVVAWWWDPEKRAVMTSAFARLKPEEALPFKAWLQFRDNSLTKDTLRTLTELEAVFSAPQAGK